MKDSFEVVGESCKRFGLFSDRVQQEMDRVIGGRQPVAEDRKSLPYTNAVIH